MRRRSALSVAAAAALAAGVSVTAAPARGQNLFTNPGFETGDFTGWTVPTGALYTGMAVATDGTPLPPSSAVLNVRGGSFAGASSTSTFSFFNVTQTVSVQPGAIYEIGGWVSLGLGNAGASGNLAIGDNEGNSFGAEVVLRGGFTPADFVRVSRLYQAKPDQAAATITLEGIVGRRSSWDDLFMTPWATPRPRFGSSGRDRFSRRRRGCHAGRQYGGEVSRGRSR